ncbi:MAG: hypothetical protein HYR91_08100 [Flavobacteriia bacterium]|nr:hypothetical protein [Flavobacteriia bacterium]
MISCFYFNESKPDFKKTNNKNLISQDDSLDFIQQTIATVPSNSKPILGYRFVIEGDFNGDGKSEKLIEHYFSGKTNQETTKFYTELENYDQLVALTINKQPISFIASTDQTIDSLIIGNASQLLGLSFLKNEGDLNGDGTDEISYIMHWADWSNLNTCWIMTYYQNHWKPLYKFSIWDWQLPDLPEICTNYNLFGHDDKNLITANDSIQKLKELELLNFDGLIRKKKKNIIEVFHNHQEEGTLDTCTIRLRKLH